MRNVNWLPTDRIGLLNAVSTWLLLLLVTRARVPWTVVPPLLWSALVAVAALHLILAAQRIGRLPAVRPGARVLPRSAAAAAQLLLALALLIGASGFPA